jgi:hypothetical protein
MMTLVVTLQNRLISQESVIGVLAQAYAVSTIAITLQKGTAHMISSRYRRKYLCFAAAASIAKPHQIVLRTTQRAKINLHSTKASQIEFHRTSLNLFSAWADPGGNDLLTKIQIRSKCSRKGDHRRLHLLGWLLKTARKSLML